MAMTRSGGELLPGRRSWEVGPTMSESSGRNADGLAINPALIVTAVESREIFEQDRAREQGTLSWRYHRSGGAVRAEGLRCLDRGGEGLGRIAESGGWPEKARESGLCCESVGRRC